jgi:hypothetical protein
MVLYINLKERARLVAENEGQGLRMIHDNCAPDWKPAQEPRGTMIFTDETPIVLEPPPEPVRDLASEVDQLKADLAAIKTKLGIK